MIAVKVRLLASAVATFVLVSNGVARAADVLKTAAATTAVGHDPEDKADIIVTGQKGTADATHLDAKAQLRRHLAPLGLSL